jgi:hypothetical protein
VFHRLIAVAVTVFALGALLAPVPADAQPGHWRTEEEFLSATGPEWQPIAPGVYELRRESGRVTRIGFGVESFRWALDEARAEQADLMTKVGGADLEKRLRATNDLIEYLGESLYAADAELSPDEARLANKATNSDSTCAGRYNLNVSFTCGFSNGTTTSTATWGEFGPFAPYKKNMHTYAYAADSPGSSFYDEDTDTTGAFSGHCCVQVQSQATSPGQTSDSYLYGDAYISIWNGCSDFRFVSDSGTC